MRLHTSNAGAQVRSRVGELDPACRNVRVHMLHVLQLKRYQMLQLTILRVFVLSLQSCPTLRPDALLPARLLCPWDSPGKNTGVGCYALLQGIFQTQRSSRPRDRTLQWQAGSSTSTLQLRPPVQPRKKNIYRIIRR